MQDAPSLNTVRNKLVKFKAFLTANGAQLLSTTSEWEVLRFDSHKGVGIIYRNKRGDCRFTGEAARAWKAYRNADKWNGEVKKPRGIMTPKVRTLLDRDGDACFLCKLPLGEDITVEHLVAVTHGGPRHISNLFLAHHECNKLLGHLSAVEKIRLRESHVTPCACAGDEKYERIAG